VSEATLFEPMPARGDPRWRFFAILCVYVLLGLTVLGFNRSPSQILTVLALGCSLEVLFHFFFKRRTIIFPLSAAISSLR
jgi:quinol-cytochrome oxidoreductase complex cytochrome b subunit